MKVLKVEQIREADAYTMQHEPIASIDLMERAANTCTEWIRLRFGKDNKFSILVGPGNNGGDGWAIARQLAEQGYDNIKLYLLGDPQKISTDAQINRRRLMEQGKVPVSVISDSKDIPISSKGTVIIDALFGSGLTRPLEGKAALLVQQINKADSTVISIDMPSGLFGEDNTGNISDHIVRATHTLTFQFPKLSMFFSENHAYVGDWHVLPIGLHHDFIEKVTCSNNFLEKEDIKKLWKPRSKFSHKGSFGHGLLITGSYGMMGAAILGARAALRSGIGLVSAHIPKKGYEIMQTSVPEAIVSLDDSENMFSKVPGLELYNAIGIGPGLGKARETGIALHSLLKMVNVPIVIDADGLNLLAENQAWLDLLPGNTIITPHPKEFDRLFGPAKSSYERWNKQLEMSQKYKLVIVLKGAHTSIALPDGTCYFNSSGNEGMATGGMGDVLTGIILSLLAQRYTPENAALLGVYLHGLAADLAVEHISKPSLVAGDVIEHISIAFSKLEVQ